MGPERTRGPFLEGWLGMELVCTKLCHIICLVQLTHKGVVSNYLPLGFLNFSFKMPCIIIINQGMLFEPRLLRLEYWMVRRKADHGRQLCVYKETYFISWSTSLWWQAPFFIICAHRTGKGASSLLVKMGPAEASKKTLLFSFCTKVPRQKQAFLTFAFSRPWLSQLPVKKRASDGRPTRSH